ncbi:unnamed protein product [Nippostrongylus brasiliensis]|uniref:SCP domain-containing protein n=1 Tax=Nippostrongylus brasiliensis TaxID=27835 RepID=A0A0N4YZL3_NIPBR|nr:unnamed protein product [Nippostrongylus brasiliensis]
MDQNGGARVTLDKEAPNEVWREAYRSTNSQNDPNDQSFPSIIGKTPALSEYLCWQLTSEDNVRSYFLNFLNGLRQGLIYQDVNCGGRRKCRSPQNYYELAYDCRLEAYAQKIVDSCGTNLTEVEGTSFIASVKESATSCDVMPMLLEEFQIGWDNVTTSSVNYRNPTFNSEDVRQFAVIANGKATRVGCAQKFCGDENNLHTACYFNAP